MPPSQVALSSFRVAKFGGTSVQDQTAINRVAEIVCQEVQDANLSPTGSMVIVLSAMGGITDLLLGAAEAAVKHLPPASSWENAQKTFQKRHQDAIEALLPASPERQQLSAIVAAATAELGAICQSISVLGEHTPRILDMTAARGERCLAQLFCAVLKCRGLNATYIDATELISVERQFGTLFPDLLATAANVEAKVLPLLKKGCTVVVPGFIGRGPEGELVTLGRGGSDLSATVLAHSLSARNVTLWKEVDGLLTADPQHVPEARIVPELHYREAAELAYYGAKVLHPRTIIPLLQQQIPLTVRSSLQPHLPGTRIAGDVPPGAFPVKALTAVMKQALLSIEGKGMMGVPGIAARTFNALAQAGISVSVISQASSEASICFVVPMVEAAKAVQVLREAFRFETQHRFIEDVRARDNLAVIAVVGLGMKGTKGIAARVFHALASCGVNVEAIAQGSSELNISVVVDAAKVSEGLAALHREFHLEKLRALPPQSDGEVCFALCGAGQIGRTLLKQIQAQRTYFNDKMGLDLRCIGLADRSGLLVCEGGFDDQRLTELIAGKEGGRRLFGDQARNGEREFTARLWQLPVKKGVFIDVTADETAPLVLSALDAGWHVVVANKKPLAVSQESYDALFAMAAKRGVSLRYEATVGAGLPVLDTIAKLEDAGDEVKTILGCFSGTLGFLMTELMDGTSFSDAVRRAHALGYTEPDPREDLSGMDVARKALILARTLGMRLELKDLHVESLFPAELSADDPQIFMNNLKALDKGWADRVSRAKHAGMQIRYVARISRDQVSVGLESVPADAPLGRLRGSDNQVTITTKRYDKNPLIVSGPGAGAEVTAAGVLNDILAIATAADRPVIGRQANLRPLGSGK